MKNAQVFNVQNFEAIALMLRRSALAIRQNVLYTTARECVQTRLDAFPLLPGRSPGTEAIPGKGGRKFHMRNYELTFIVPSDVSEDDMTGVVTQVQGWVEGSQGKVVKVDHWGRRHLAYQIGDYNEGYYVLLNLEMNPQETLELERNLKLSDRIIRYLLIRTDGD